MKFSDKKTERTLILLAVDLAIVAFSYSFAAFIESKFFIRESIGEIFAFDMFILLGTYFLCFVIFGIHKIVWRYAGIRDLTVIILACFTADVVYMSFNVIKFGYSRFMFTILICILVPLLLICSRIAYRFLFNRTNSKPIGHLNLAIIGAGNGAVSLLKNFGTVCRDNYNQVYLFDDSILKLNRKVIGRLVVGKIDDLPKKCKELKIDEIIIAIPSATAELMNRIVDNCLKTNCKFFTLPLMSKEKKLNPQDFIKQKRKVNINDLLGREEIIIHDKDMKDFIVNKIVMVTGGGGSIGSELCRQIASLKPTKLIILDVYENNAYEIQQELKIKYNTSLNLIVEIATIRDNEKIDFVFNKYRPQVVFHAAAHKHVPLMESNPEEAIKNNVFGTHNVINACDKYGVENFILISSDKAVNPTNIMGATKRICEMMVQSMKGNSKTIFSAVRFGNVLGSNGSVIPLFKRQIENGGPVTVTDKNMVRYFMTIPEAVSLVMEAAKYSKGGEVFVLDMGKPINIDDFARKLIKLSGYDPDKDIKVIYTGLRPGEKMYEELILNKENSFATENDKIFIEKLTTVSPLFINNALIELKEGIQNNNIEDIKNSVKEVVDTYKIKEELAITNDQANLKKIMNENIQDLSFDKRKAAI